MVRLWFHSGGNKDGWWELRVERRKHPEARPTNVVLWPLSVLKSQIAEILTAYGTQPPPPTVRKRRRATDRRQKP